MATVLDVAEYLGLTEQSMQKISISIMSFPKQMLWR